MQRIALWFFAVAPVYVLLGMVLGMVMGATNNFTFAPVHAHINLLGWVTMALYGTFYSLYPSASQRLARIVFWFQNIGLIGMAPTLALLLKFGPKPEYIIPLTISELMVFTAMACFAFSVWGVLGKSASTPQSSVAFRPMAAE